MALPSSALMVVDCANINMSFANDGALNAIDYRRLRETLGALSGRHVTEAVACTFQGHSSNQREFMARAASAGYAVVTRPLRIVDDQSGRSRLICNQDTEIATEALLRAHAHETVIIASGDADFVPLVHSLRNAGKRVLVAGNGKSISRELREAVGFECVINLLDSQSAIASTPHQHAPPPIGHGPITRKIGDELGNPQKRGQCALLIDVQNVFHAARVEGWAPDWEKVVQAAARFGDVGSVHLFSKERIPRVLKELFARFEGRGWKVHSKKAKSDGTTSVSVEMACTGIEEARKGRSIFMATGSGHLLPTVRRLRENGVALGLMSPSANLAKIMRTEFGPEEFYSMSAHRSAVMLKLSGFHHRHSSGCRPHPPVVPPNPLVPAPPEFAS